MNGPSRSVIVLGTAMLAGGLMEGTAAAQILNLGPPPADYPTPEAPTCIMHQVSDCRLPDGHPDLTGLWVLGGPGLQNGLASGADDITFAGRGDSFVGFETDGGLYRESTVDSGDVNHPNFPMYKPQYWDQITDNEYNGNTDDPEQECLPPGVPRLGPPSQILAIKDQPLVLLFYNGGYSRDVVRQVWTDGRKHNPLTVATETWDGDAVGHWEGDTLVIESTGFTDASWLHKNGYIHGFNMTVTEKLTRLGNMLEWDATVDDPDYLMQPWALTPEYRFLNGNPNAELVETLPCLELDREHEMTHARDG